MHYQSYSTAGMPSGMSAGCGPGLALLYTIVHYCTVLKLFWASTGPPMCLQLASCWPMCGHLQIWATKGPSFFAVCGPSVCALCEPDMGLTTFALCYAIIFGKFHIHKEN